MPGAPIASSPAPLTLLRRAVAMFAILAAVNRYLDSIALFVLDADGIVRASSNWDQPDSFVGEDLSSRDDDRQAANSFTGRQFAIGTTLGMPGGYVPRLVIERQRIVGVTVIKIPLDRIGATWLSLGAPALIADANGVIILSAEPKWMYTALEPLGPEGTIVDLTRPLPPARVRSHHPERYPVMGRTVPETGWRLMVFADLTPVRNQALGAIRTLAGNAQEFIRRGQPFHRRPPGRGGPRQHLFEPFLTTKPASEGTPLRRASYAPARCPCRCQFPETMHAQH